MTRLSFQPIGDSWALVAVLLIAMLAVTLAVGRPAQRGVSRAKRIAEFALRLAMLALFAVLFTRPAMIRVEKEELPASILVLCDLSESMTIRDESDGRSRYEAMRDVLEQSKATISALCEKFDVRFLGFGETSRDLKVVGGEVEFPEAPSESETLIGSTLNEALGQTAGSRLLSVVVMSDGAQRARDKDAIGIQEIAERYHDAQRAIVATPFGREESANALRDVAIADLRANDRVFVGNDLAVSGQLQIRGFQGVEIPLQLELETSPGHMEVVDQTTVTPTGDDFGALYQFTCRPSEPGAWKLRVSSPLQPDELVETNNELGAYVEALDRGVEILYIEGSRRYEQNFLRAALESSSDLHVKYWRPPVSSLIAKNPNTTEAELVAKLAETRKSLVDTFFGESQYAVYVLGDVDSSAFQPDELQALAERVDQGSGLVLLSGERSFSAGGYAGTPLADAFPTRLTSDRLPLDSDLAQFDANADSGQKIRIDGQFQPELADDEGALGHFAVALSLDGKKNAELWREMPPVNTIYRLGAVKPNARTLLQARAVDGRNAVYPLLLAQTFGQGRVVALATDSTWRWRMRGKENEHAKFWRQIFQWVAKVDELLEGELAIELDKTRFERMEDVEFQVVYRPKPGQTLDRSVVRATLVSPDQTRQEIELTEENGAWRGVVGGSKSVGDYRLEAELTDASGAALQTSQAQFLVSARNLELEQPQASPRTLERLVNASNGRIVPPEAFQSYLEELLQQRETIVDYRQVKRSLYDVWTFFALFVALMSIDWTLRKLWGMA